MANLVPVVTPANNAQGVAIGTEPTAVFGQSMEAGSLTSASCFLVEIPTHSDTDLNDYLANAALGNIVPAEVVVERLNLLDDNAYTALDFGTDGDSGEKYRSRVTINPDALLKPNTTYAALLSKDISLITVYDPEPNGGNSGTGVMLSEGLFEGLTSDTYTVTITATGTQSNAKYMWTRTSDAYVSNVIDAKDRFIDIDQGLKIKFTDGSYTIGDSFIVRVVPADKQVDIYSWTFSTGPESYQTPDDENSGDLLNIPVSGGSSSSSDSLYVTSIDPANASTLLKIPRKASVTVGDVDFITRLYTSSYNDYTVEFVDGGTAGSESVALVGSDITITLEAGVSTAQQVSDAFNASGLVNTNFEASTQSAATLQTAEDQKEFGTGVDQTTVTITFNKNIDAGSITDQIKVTTLPIYPTGAVEDVNFSTVVSGNQITLTLEEQS
jgi:hypothetical protein